MNATWNGLTFVGGGGAATYTLETLTGWWGGVEMRHDSIPRPSGPGEFDAPAFLSGRVITLTGLILADDDPEAFEDAMTALEDAGADGSKSEFAVAKAGGGRATAQARRHGAVDIADIVYGRHARYQLQLWAPDPTKGFAL